MLTPEASTENAAITPLRLDLLWAEEEIAEDLHGKLSAATGKNSPESVIKTSLDKAYGLDKQENTTINVGATIHGATWFMVDADPERAVANGVKLFGDSEQNLTWFATALSRLGYPEKSMEFSQDKEKIKDPVLREWAAAFEAMAYALKKDGEHARERLALVTTPDLKKNAGWMLETILK